MSRLSSGVFAGNVILVTIVCLFNPSYADEPKRPSLEFLVIDGKTPARLVLNFTINGKGYTEHWDTTFKQLLNFFDRNGDGSLDQKEAARLPSLLSFRRSVSSGFLPPIGDAPIWKDLDQNMDDKVTFEELSKYYRERGVGLPQVGVGAFPHSEELTKAIIQTLDSDKDNQISEEEWKFAFDKLAKLDKNDDELIGVSELVPKATYPGTNPTILLNSPRKGTPRIEVLEKLPLIRLPMDQTNFDWINELESRAKSINKNELASWREKPATKSFTLSLSEKFDRPENFSMVHHKIHIEGWTTKGRIFDAFKEVHTEFIPSIVPTKEPISRKARPRGEDSQAWLIEIADRNGDNKLDENETTIWLNLQKQIITGQVFIGVYYKGGLFELLDTNHDGALSIRELKNGWQRLKETNTLADGKLDPNKLPQVLLCVISLGSAKSITIDPLKGPSWFQAMDRNRDGDVSRREFTGPKEIFDKIDTNKDDLIDAEEAEKYRPRK